MQEYTRISDSLNEPDPAGLLYENLFDHCEREKTLEIISEGLTACLENADSLIQDAKILANNKRYSTAIFLLTTADEEMAKSYILLDACRLDFLRNLSEQKRLCKAFYNHIYKYAYYKVLSFPSVTDLVRVDSLANEDECENTNMIEIKKLWRGQIRKWWPNESIENGEPPMPHEIRIIREGFLYVDFDDWMKQWCKPYAERRKFVVDTFLFDKFPESNEALEQLRFTYNSKLYSPESLSILNDNFKNLYVNTNKKTVQIARQYDNVAQQIENEMGISKQTFDKSALRKLPLYYFLTINESDLWNI